MVLVESFPRPAFAQLHKKWCWAAVTRYIELIKGMYLSDQCTIAAGCIGSCYGNCSSKKHCDRVYVLGKLLNDLGYLIEVIDHSVSEKQIIHEIDSKRPVPIRIAWNQGQSGHFIMVIGYENIDGNVVLKVFDPVRPGCYINIPYSELLLGYKSVGSWSHTYRVI